MRPDGPIRYTPRYDATPQRVAEALAVCCRIVLESVAMNEEQNPEAPLASGAPEPLRRLHHGDPTQQGERQAQP
jgi:hypothetical protein